MTTKKGKSGRRSRRRGVIYQYSPTIKRSRERASAKRSAHSYQILEPSTSNQNIFKIQRVVRGFEKEGDKLVEEIPLDGADISILQELFGVPSDNPMYDCYPIETQQQIEYIQKITKFRVNPQSYGYFLECDAI
jgi:hypothetical protein